MRTSKFDASAQSEILSEAQQLVQGLLTDAAKNPHQLMQTMRQTFGSSLDKRQAEALIEQWSKGEFGTLPDVEVLPHKVMGTAQGAYAESTDTIYLSKGLLRHAAATDDLTGVAGVLLEEVGHSIDPLVNRFDASGDEGEIFSALLQGQDLSPLAMEALKSENDFGTLSLNGQQVGIEMSQIAMAEFNGRLFQIHRGGEGRMYLRSSSDGTNWTGWREISAGGNTPNAISITAFNGRLYATHRGLDNSIYTTSSADGQTWGSWERATGATPDGFAKTPDAPSMTVFGNRLYQAHRGLSNQIFIRSSTDGRSWSDWQRVDGETPDAISMTTFNNRLYVSHRGLDNNIYTRTFDGARWTPWERATGATPDGFAKTPDAPAMGVFNNRLYQIHRGTDNEMYMRSTNGNSWTDWVNQGGQTPSAPFMTAFRGRFYQTHQGLDDNPANNNIYTRSSSDAANWSNWASGNGFTPVDRDALPQGNTSSGGGTTATADINEALKFTLRWEGGYVNHPNDPGGATNKGITQGTYNSYRRSLGLATRNVRGITDQEVRTIYNNNYWLRAGCDKLPSKLAIAHFDATVNHGPGNSRSMLQQAQAAGGSEMNMVRRYLDIRENFFRSIVARKPKQEVFLRGWLRRVNDLRRELGV